jgi:hypothetical protein
MKDMHPARLMVRANETARLDRSMKPLVNAGLVKLSMDRRL